ncbi:MAG: methylmalonyl-CoA mutase family protein [Hyphomicrobium sp.]
MTANGPASLVKLADGFAPPTLDQWRGLVDKAIKGADFDKRLVSKTADGLRVEPLYTPAHSLTGSNDALPGAAPFVRGTKAVRDGLGWDIRQMHIGTDAVAVNQAILDDLEGGVISIVLQIAAPGGLGLAPDEANLTRALNGVMLDLCTISLVAGDQTATAAASLKGLWDHAKVPLDQRKAAYGFDPIGELARTGRLNSPIDQALGAAAKLAVDAAKLPGVTALRADGVPYHIGGASEAQELALMLSTLVAYLRACEAAGLKPADALPKIEVTLAIDDEQFMGIAKLRAARQLVWRVADACGAGDAAAQVPFNAVTSYRMMAKRDVWTNIIRTTISCASAALGGADAICVLPFTFALGQPDAFARRVARNIQIVCQEESNLGRVADPAGGSWYVENLTSDLAQKAWDIFQSIEAQSDKTGGGIVAALKCGFVQDEIAKVAAARATAIATGRMEITGVSAFPKLGDDGVTAELWPRPAAPSGGPVETIRPLTMARLAEPFEALRDVADQYAAATKKPFTVFLASLGEVIDHNVRSTWIKNYLAAGGIAAEMSDGYPNAQTAAEAFKASGATAACICSSDAINAEHAESTAKALKAAGASYVLMAGRPGEREASLKTAGVDQFLFAGADAVATLKGLQGKLAG